MNLVKDDEDKISIKDMLARVSTLTPLSLCGPRLELRDKDLEEEKVSVRDNH